ncbi:MAG: HEAT repeat domain-containing protein [Candidatus Ozemobacteraceae bacterium]
MKPAKGASGAPAGESAGDRPSWGNMACGILETGNPVDREAVLEFLGRQSEPLESDAARLLPLIQGELLSTEPTLRYHARKAQDHLFSLFPKLCHQDDAMGSADGPAMGFPDSSSSSSSSAPPFSTAISTSASTSTSASASASASFTTREILLKKMWLGSRYLAFEAIERLTDSRDPTLAEPLLGYLEAIDDSFKVAYLVKRLTRITHPKIPGAVQKYLQHSDPRVVANAIEGLAEIDAPDLRDVFRGLARSPDNRIRANAIRALAKYDSTAAEAYIEEMLRSSSVALQDSALFLIGTLRSPRTEALLEIAFNSPYTTVRLRALEIPRLLEKIQQGKETQADQARARLLPPTAPPSEPLTGLGVSLVAGFVCNCFWPAPYPLVAVGLGLVGFLLLFSSAYHPRDPRLWPWGLTILFLAAQATGIAGIVPVFGWLTIWLGIPGTACTPGCRRGRLFAWGFAVFAALINWWLGGVEARFVGAMTGFIPAPASDGIVEDTLAQFRQFSNVFYMATAIGCFLFVRWGGFDENARGENTGVDRHVEKEVTLFKRFAAGLLVLFVLQGAFVLGIKARLVTRGLTDILVIPGFFGR